MVLPYPEDVEDDDVSAELPEEGHSTLAMARVYLSAGMSIIPVGRDKRPHPTLLPRRGSWSAYQTAPPPAYEVEAWVRQDPTVGLAVVCGHVSGNGNYLVACDVDNPLFASWLEEHLSENLLTKTWTVRTGSGKLHVWLYSRTPVYTKVLVAQGERLGELRADGSGGRGPSYVCVPPSLHPSGGRYVTLFGDPRRIAAVPDADDVWQRIVALYVGRRRLAAGGKAAMTIDQPLRGAAAESMLQRIVQSSLSGKVKRAIQAGAEPGDGEWIGYASHSEIDAAIVTALRRVGFSHEDIQAIYATFPIGEATYRNTRRPHHGNSYLLRTIETADEHLQREREAAKRRHGINFSVLEVHRVLGDEPFYELKIRHHERNDYEREIETATVRMSHEELTSMRKFQEAVSRSMRLWPELREEYQTRRGYGRFVDVLLTMATETISPPDATPMGHIQATILGILRSGQRILPAPPASKEELRARMGWRDDREGAYFIRGPELYAQLCIVMRPPPSITKVWQVLHAMGTTGRRVRIQGIVDETVWVVPVAAVEQRRPPGDASSS